MIRFSRGLPDAALLVGLTALSAFMFVAFLAPSWPRTVWGWVISAALGLPLLVLGLGTLLGLSGLPFAVMLLAACLPIGANVFLFSQRYHTSEELVTASVAVSTVLGLVTVTVVMALVAHLQ